MAGGRGDEVAEGDAEELAVREELQVVGHLPGHLDLGGGGRRVNHSQAAVKHCGGVV